MKNKNKINREKRLVFFNLSQSPKGSADKVEQNESDSGLVGNVSTEADRYEGQAREEAKGIQYATLNIPGDIKGNVLSRARDEGIPIDESGNYPKGRRSTLRESGDNKFIALGDELVGIKERYIKKGPGIGRPGASSGETSGGIGRPGYKIPEEQKTSENEGQDSPENARNRGNIERTLESFKTSLESKIKSLESEEKSEDEISMVATKKMIRILKMTNAVIEGAKTDSIKNPGKGIEGLLRIHKSIVLNEQKTSQGLLVESESKKQNIFNQLEERKFDEIISFITNVHNGKEDMGKFESLTQPKTIELIEIQR